MLENLRQIKYALLYENNKLSKGCLMLLIVFILMMVLWIVGIFKPSVIVPESMLDAFYGLLGFNGGTKIAGIARTVVEKSKAAQQSQKTANVDSPDA